MVEDDNCSATVVEQLDIVKTKSEDEKSRLKFEVIDTSHLAMRVNGHDTDSSFSVSAHPYSALTSDLDVDDNATPPSLTVTGFSALNDCGMSLSSCSSEEEKSCLTSIIDTVEIRIEEESVLSKVTEPPEFQSKSVNISLDCQRNTSSNISQLTVVDSVKKSANDVETAFGTVPVVDVALDKTSSNDVNASSPVVLETISQLDEVSEPLKKKLFTGLDDVLFNLADIPVESYSARQRCTVNSEHQKEEARAQKQREREAERHQQAAAAASAQHAAMHAAAAGVHHHSSMSHSAISVPNPYAAHSLHYGSAAAAAALHHLQPRHAHVQAQQAVQYHLHQQQYASQQAAHSQQQQQKHQVQLAAAAADATAALAATVQAQHNVPSIYSNYTHAIPQSITPDYGSMYGSSTSSSQIRQSAHHNAPPPPAHQHCAQQLHGGSMSSLSNPSLHQQSSLALQHLHQSSAQLTQHQSLASQQLYQQSVTPQHIHSQPLTPQMPQQPLTPQMHQQPLTPQMPQQSSTPHMHQQPLTPQMSQQSHSANTQQTLQRSLTPQQVHQQSCTPKLVHQRSLTPQQVYQQPLTPHQVYHQPHTPLQMHQPMTPVSVAPPSSISPLTTQYNPQCLSSQNTPPLSTYQQGSAQTSPGAMSNASHGSFGGSTALEQCIHSMKDSNGLLTYSCKVCGKAYNNRSSLRSHMKKHYPEGEKPFKCEHCNYSSHYRANLKKHIDTNHNEDRERCVPCELCHKSFFNENQMRDHMKLHNIDGSVTHRCEQCSKSFKTKLRLKHHMDVHNPSKPFICDMDGCDRAFRTAKYLKNHKDEFHKLQPKRFECPVDNCEMVFYKKDISESEPMVANVSRLSGHIALSSSDEASSDDEDDEDESDNELPPPLLPSHHVASLPSRSSGESSMFSFQTETELSFIGQSKSNGAQTGPPSLLVASMSTSGGANFSDSEDIKLDSQIDGIITNLEEDSNLMGLGFLQPPQVTCSNTNGSLRNNIDNIVVDMMNRSEAELPTASGLPPLSEHEMCVVRDSFQRSISSLSNSSSVAEASTTASNQTLRKRCRSREMTSPAAKVSSINSTTAAQRPLSRFEPLRHIGSCTVEIDSPQPPSLEQQQPVLGGVSLSSLTTQHFVNNRGGGGDIPDIISSVTVGSNGGGVGSDKDTDCSPRRKFDQRDLLDEVLEDIQQLQDKEKQAASVYSKSASIGGLCKDSAENDLSGSANIVQHPRKSLDSSFWSDSGYSSSVPHDKDSCIKGGQTTEVPKQESRAPSSNTLAASADLKNSSLMAGLDAAATGSLSSFFRPNVAADLYSNYYRQQAYGMVPSANPQGIPATYDPYRSLSALGSKYMDASANYSAAAAVVAGQSGVPCWPPVSGASRPSVSAAYSMPNVSSGIGSHGLNFGGSGSIHEVHMPSALHLPQSSIGWPNPLAPGANSASSEYIGVPNYSDYLGRAFDPTVHGHGSLETYRGAASASELYSQMVAASAGSYGQFYGQAAAARDGLMYSGAAASSRLTTAPGAPVDNPFQFKQPPPGYPDSRSYMPGPAGYTYGPLSSSPYARVPSSSNPYAPVATDYLGRVTGTAPFGAAAAAAYAATSADPYRNPVLHNMTLNRYPF